MGMALIWSLGVGFCVLRELGSRIYKPTDIVLVSSVDWSFLRVKEDKGLLKTTDQP